MERPWMLDFMKRNFLAQEKEKEEVAIFAARKFHGGSRHVLS